MSRHRLRPALRHVMRVRLAVEVARTYDDIPDITALWSMRLALSAYEGALIRLRRDSDNAEQDFGFDENGDLDTAAIATFVGEGSGFFKTWYDQSGNERHATQETDDDQPLYVADGQNGHPAARFDGTDDYYRVTSFWSAYPFEILTISRQISGDTLPIVSDAVSSATNRYETLWLDNPNDLLELQTRNTNITPAVVNVGDVNDFAINSGIWASGTSRTARRNGVSGVTGTASNTHPSSDEFFIGRLRTSSPIYFNGEIAEIVATDALWSDSDRIAAEGIAQAYWQVNLNLPLAGPYTLSLIDRSAPLEADNAQGVAYDGTNYYFSDNGTLYKFSRDSETNAYTLVTSRSVSGDDPSAKSQINGMNYHDGYLWVGANNFSASPRGWIVQYDPSDLSHVADFEVDNHWCEGGAWRNDPVEGDEFWAVFTDWDRVSRWRLDNGSLVKVDDYLLELVEGETHIVGERGLYQGAVWYGDVLITQTHAINNDTETHFHRWTGTGFEAVQQISALNTLGFGTIGQGIHWETFGEVLLFCERQSTGRIVRVTFTDNDA